MDNTFVKTSDKLLNASSQKWGIEKKTKSFLYSEIKINKMINTELKLTLGGGMERLIIISLLLILLLPNVQALKMLSGDQVSIDTSIDDDVFAAGGTVNINAIFTGMRELMAL